MPLVSLDEQLARPRGGDLDPRDARRRAGAAICLFLIYTSGTTGLPEGRAHQPPQGRADRAWRPGSRSSSARGSDLLLPAALPHRGRHLAVGAALMSGGSIVLARKFSASQFWSDCARYEPTLFQYIGELCRYLLNAPPHPDGAHATRSALSSATACAPTSGRPSRSASRSRASSSSTARPRATSRCSTRRQGRRRRPHARLRAQAPRRSSSCGSTSRTRSPCATRDGFCIECATGRGGRGRR